MESQNLDINFVFATSYLYSLEQIRLLVTLSKIRKEKVLKINVSQYNVYRQQYCIIIIKLAKRLDLNYSHHKKEKIIMWLDRGINNATVATILQYINVSTCCIP